MPPNTQHRSYSLTGPGATQLSQCIRERLAGSHSLPKPGSDMHMFQHRYAIYFYILPVHLKIGNTYCTSTYFHTICNALTLCN